MTDTFTFWAHFKAGRNKRKIGPFATREEALTAALPENPTHKSLMTGYGSEGAYFDIRWHDAETNPYR